MLALCGDEGFRTLEKGSPIKAVLQALAGSNTGVFVGCIWLEYGGLLAQHGASGGAFAVTGNGLAFLAGRVSYAFGFAGPCIPTNTGTQP